jgi:hypothetical protein
MNSYKPKPTPKDCPINVAMANDSSITWEEMLESLETYTKFEDIPPLTKEKMAEVVEAHQHDLQLSSGQNIDDPLVPICNALFEAGYVTRFSCCGFQFSDDPHIHGKNYICMEMPSPDKIVKLLKAFEAYDKYRWTFVISDGARGLSLLMTLMIETKPNEYFEITEVKLGDPIIPIIKKVLDDTCRRIKGITT